MGMKLNVGDLVFEKHFPDRIGVVLEVYRNGFADVRWQRRNPNNANKYSNLEKIESRYLELVQGEVIYSDTNSYGRKK